LAAALAEMIDRRKVISSRWRYTSACSSVIALLICSIVKKEVVKTIKKRGRVRVCVQAQQAQIVDKNRKNRGGDLGLDVSINLGTWEPGNTQPQLRIYCNVTEVSEGTYTKQTLYSLEQ
jgi:hypothetical protein